MFDLVSVTNATLLTWEQAAIAAYAQLQSGSKVASATYAQGDGSRSVSYSAADRTQLLAWIGQLQNEMCCRGMRACRSTRRAIGVRF